VRSWPLPAVISRQQRSWCSEKYYKASYFFSFDVVA
jgi:hypothetical protein